MVDAQFGFLAAPSVRQSDLHPAPIIQSACLIRDVKVRHMDLRAVLQKDGLSRHTGFIRHRRRVKRQRTEDDREQDGQMRDKGPVTADPVFAPDGSLSQRLALTVPVLKIRAQLLHPFGREKYGIRHGGSALGLAAGGAHHGPDAQQGTEAEIEAEQHQQRDEVPALKHTVEPERQDGRMGRGIILRVPGNLPPLRDQRPRHRADPDQDQQDNAETHGAQKSEQFFHGHVPFGKKKLSQNNGSF